MPVLPLCAAEGPLPHAPRLGAQSKAGPPPTLKEAIEAAYRRHPRQGVLASRDREAQALDRKSRSLIADNPSLSFRYEDDRALSDDGLREYELGAELPLWRPGQRGARRDLATAADEAVGHGEEALYLFVAGEVREAMWETALRKNNLAQAKREWETAQALERDVSERVRLGELAKADLLLAQEATLRSQNDYLSADADVMHALQRYRVLTGLERIPRKRGEQRDTLEDIADAHPLLAEQMALVRERQAAVDVARRERADNPSLLVGARSERDTSQEDFADSMGMTLTLPFGLESHSGPVIAAAEVELAEAQSALQQLRRELEAELAEARHHLEITEQRLALAEEQHRIAQENLRLARIAFEVGETDLVNLLRVQTLAFNAQRNEQELRISMQRAIARYNQAVGVWP